MPKEGSFLDLIYMTELCQETVTTVEQREVQDLDDDGNPRRDLNGDVITILVDHEVRTQQPVYGCLLYTSPSPRDEVLSRMPSSA